MTLVIAHRGDPHAHRENTIPAVLSAFDKGADIVEIDVTATRDGTVVLLHDQTLNRLWNHDAAIADVDYSELRALGGDYDIPTFTQVMSAAAILGRALMVDLTVPTVAEAAGDTVAAHNGFDLAVFAGPLDGLWRIRKSWPQARIALSWDNPEPPTPELMSGLRPEFFNPNWYLLDQPLLDRMHQDGYQVSTWTVDSPTNMARLLDMGVDAVISNRLDHLLVVRAHHRTKALTC